MASISNFYFFLLIVFISIVSTFSFIIKPYKNLGFTANLVHRDSPISPLYNPKNTHYDRLRNSFHRSISRANRFKPNSITSKSLIQSDIISGGGEYLMKISVGTPQLEVLGIADTGSDLIWFQCQPCEECYRQNSPIFDPRNSSSYRNVLCETKFCNKLDDEARICDTRGFVKSCGYTYSYGDKSFSDGHLAVERFSIGSKPPAYFPSIAFGCGTKNGGTFNELGSGIIGLGGGSMSLVSQLGAKISRKFSYCLILASENLNSTTSKIIFGDDITISGTNDVVSTPLIRKEPETYYYLTLEAISVGNKTLPYPNLWDGDVISGNIIIDSGTTLTFLDSEFFNDFESAIDDSIKAERVSDPNGIFRICYREEHTKFPIITAHFTDADVELPDVNTFAKVEEDLICLTMVPSNDIAIFGNLAQMNFLVGYDLDKRSVSFLPTDCARH